MAHQVPWNRSIYNTFCDLAMLSDLEMQVLETRIRNWDRAAQCEAFHLTPGRLDAIISGVEGQLSQQAVVNAQVTANLSCLQNQVAALSAMTKTVIPITNVCPEPMPLKNSWTAPTAGATT